MLARFAKMAVVCTFLPLSAYSDVISLRADSWCPFNCEPKSDKPGYMIEIAQSAFSAKGHTVDYQQLNWARAISESRKGKFVGIVGAAKGDAADFVFPAESQGYSRSCFFTKADSKWEFKGISSLTGITLGAIKDYSYTDPVDNYIAKNSKDAKSVDLVGGDTPLETNIKKLLADRIGATIEEESVLNSVLSEKKIDVKQFRKAGCAKEEDIYIAFSPKVPKAKEYAQILSDRIEAMRKDGSLKSLLTKYGLSDWKQ